MGSNPSKSTNNVVKFYKLKHVPTGLYFRPYKLYSDNLTKVGKIYSRKPSFTYVSNGIKVNGVNRTYKKEDWIIEEYETTLVKIHRP